MELSGNSLFALKEHERSLLHRSIDVHFPKFPKKQRRVTFKEHEQKRRGVHLEDMLANIKRKIRYKYEE